MGGYGSGRTGGWPTVEGCASLVLSADDITRPIRRGMRKLGMREIPEGRTAEMAWRTLRWTRRADDEPWAEIEIRLELGGRDGRAWLRYDIDHLSRPTGPQEYPVALVATPCPFGGRRWWWICPATGRRVSKLYLPNGGTRFLSRGRGAYRLDYASQRSGPLDRAHQNLARLHRKIGADYDGPDRLLPGKPKWMRWKTYSRIALQIEAGQERLHVVFSAGAVRILARFDRSIRRGTKRR